MNTFRILIAIVAVITAANARADTVNSFVGEITGLVCASCKEEVVAALVKLEGVKSVEIVPSNNPEIRKITITTKRDLLTSEDVNAVLNSVSKEFKVTKLNKAG